MPNPRGRAVLPWILSVSAARASPGETAVRVLVGLGIRRGHRQRLFLLPPEAPGAGGHGLVRRAGLFSDPGVRRTDHHGLRDRRLRGSARGRPTSGTGT
ncbi:MAG: hypothetical protein MZV70_05745 [Desulfobacterales bacterium]|nr:hypothetical protein [Desulfobacterales bacterium]